MYYCCLYICISSVQIFIINYLKDIENRSTTIVWWYICNIISLLIQVLIINTNLLYLYWLSLIPFTLHLCICEYAFRWVSTELASRRSCEWANLSGDSVSTTDQHGYGHYWVMRLRGACGKLSRYFNIYVRLVCNASIWYIINISTATIIFMVSAIVKLPLD